MKPFKLTLFLFLSACSAIPPPPGEPCDSWQPDTQGPVIGFEAFGGLAWNDPWVLEEAGAYRMWASSGAGGVGVSVYELHSSDGVTWTPAKLPLGPELVPGPDAFDVVATETPNVVKLGDAYHMYYTAVPDGNPAHYTIGHATSHDGGTTWTKDAAPALTRPTDPNAWGAMGVAEPGATIKGGVVYLYYATVRCRGGDASCAQGAERAIGLATSPDGTTFTIDPASPVATQSSAFPTSAAYEGYSTPAAIVVNERVHLFYDVVQRVDGKFRQVALIHAASDDGRAFVEMPTGLTRASTNWTTWEIRSPTVVAHGTGFDMWFAGNNGNDPKDPNFVIGIGHAASQGCE